MEIIKLRKKNGKANSEEVSGLTRNITTTRDEIPSKKAVAIPIRTLYID